MKQYTKIIIMILLFQMIVLPVISQTKYVTKNDTTYCYTANDNRIIALIMLDGERDSSLLIQCNKDYNNLKLDFNNINIEFNKCDTIGKQLIKDNDNLYNLNIKYKHNIKLWEIIGVSSLSLNIILLIIVL